MRLSLQILSQPKDLTAISEPWYELSELSHSATPFQTPEWCLPWWNHFGSGTLSVLSFVNAGKLLGLAPFFTRNEENQRTVQAIGTGNTDYLDILTHPDHEKEILAGVSNFLRENPKKWDLCDFQEIRPDAVTANLELPTSQISRVTQSICPVVPLARTWEELRMVWSSGHFTKVMKYRRRLERQGNVQYEAVCAQNFETLFDTIIQLHQRQWQEQEMALSAGIFSDPQSIAFHKEVARGFLKSGALRLYTLTLNGIRIAAIYGFVHRKRAYYYISGFDPLYASFSPGTLIIVHAMEEALKEGLVEFDFLRGQEPYKYRWGAQDRPNYRISCKLRRN